MPVFFELLEFTFYFVDFTELLGDSLAVDGCPSPTHNDDKLLGLAGFEIDITTDHCPLTGFRKLRAEFRVHGIQWNAEIPAGIFDPNIPADYTEIKVTDLIPPEAKAGLVGLVAIPAGFIFWKKRRKRAKAGRNE